MMLLYLKSPGNASGAPLRGAIFLRKRPSGGVCGACCWVCSCQSLTSGPVVVALRSAASMPDACRSFRWMEAALRPETDLGNRWWSSARECLLMRLALRQCGALPRFVAHVAGIDRLVRAPQKAIDALDGAAPVLIQIRHPSPQRRRCHNAGKPRWCLHPPNAEFRGGETSAHRKCSHTDPPRRLSRHDCGAYVLAGDERSK